MNIFQAFLNWLSGLFKSKFVLPAMPWEWPCNDGQVSQGAHPERKPQSEYMFNLIKKNWAILSKATDLYTLIPRGLTVEQEQACLTSIMITVAEYESSWNPLCTAKDVNGRSEPPYLARGYFQMNVFDQSAYQTGTKYSYTELNDPYKNMEVGINILVTMVRLRGKITFAVEEKSPVLSYFYATLLTNGKVGPKVIKSARERVASLNFATVQKIPIEQRLRDRIVTLWQSDLDQYETKGSNRSPMIDEVNTHVSGAYLGAPYCIAGLVYRGIMAICKEEGLKMPSWMNTASTQSFYNSAPDKYKISKDSPNKAKKGDIGIQQRYSNPDQGHAYGFRADENYSQLTIEYNTDPGGSRNGDGVYERTRSRSGDAEKKYRGSVDVIKAILEANGVQ